MARGLSNLPPSFPGNNRVRTTSRVKRLLKQTPCTHGPNNRGEGSAEPRVQPCLLREMVDVTLWTGSSG